MRPLLTLLTLSLTHVAWAHLIEVPYVNDFSRSGDDFFAPTHNGYSAGHEYREEIYQTWITVGNRPVAATVEARALGGPAATATDCVMRCTVDPVEIIGNNTIGFGALGLDARLTGGAGSGYYLADVRILENRIRIVRVSNGNTFIGPERDIAGLDVSDLAPFDLELVITYNAGEVQLAFTVTKGGASDTLVATDANVLTGSHFGFRSRTSTATADLDVRFDDFELRPLHAVTSTNLPPRLVSVGAPYTYTPMPVAEPAAAVSVSALELPPWLQLNTGTLSGTPGTNDLGMARVHLQYASPHTQVDEAFTVSVIGFNEPVISEFMADNEETLFDEDGDSSDWIELFNPAPSNINLTGWFLSDDPTGINRWPLPAVELPPLSFTNIFASGKTNYAHHAPFRLNDRAGEFLALLRPDLSMASAYTYPKQEPDVSYGLFGDYTQAGFLLEPTPAAANSPTGRVDFVGDTVFSLDRGFYQGLQVVTVQCFTAGATLVTTTNGSTPSLTNGAATFAGVSNAPIAVYEVSQTTTLRARAFKPGWVPSNTDTQSYLFLADLVTQHATGAAPPGWPSGSVNGQRFDYGMDPEITGAHSFDEMAAAITNLQLISLVTDLAQFIDPGTGIWVNAEDRGRFWERPVSVEWIEANGSPGFQEDGGVRIRGGASRSGSNPKHSLRLSFRDKPLRFPLFGAEGDDRFRRVDLRCTQGNSWHRTGSGSNTFLRDVFARDSQRDMGMPYTRSRYHHVLINGVYFGLFQTQERANRHWAESYFGGSDDDYDMVKSSTQPHRVEAIDGDGGAWGRLFDAATAGFAADADYFAVQGLDPNGQPDAGGTNLVDVVNLIDYMLVIFYTGQTDGPVSIGALVPKNFYCFRPRDGRFGFRFLVHDNEDSLNSTTRDVTVFRDTGDRLSHFNPKWLHQQLMQNPRYRRLFGDRAHRHLFNGGALTPEATMARYAARAAEIDEAVLAESARWGDAARTTPRTRNDWLNAVNGVNNTFFPSRTSVLVNQLRSQDLYPEVSAPGFCAETNGVAIYVEAGAIFYSRDPAIDPMDPGATLYTDPLPITQGLLRARALFNGAWSALAETPLPLSNTHCTLVDLRQTDGFPEIDALTNAVWTGINFTVAGGAIVPPFANDSGRLFDAGRGYGWLADLSAQNRQRNIYPEPLRDTLVFTRQQDTWEAVVSNGWYRVRVCIGDSGFLQGPQHVQLEGVPLAANVITAIGTYWEAESLVEVTDGRLSVVFGQPNTANPPQNTTPNWLTYIELAQSDSDLDRINDGWEVEQVGDLASLGIGDFDGDGSPDRAEYLFHTDPADGNDFLRVHTRKGTDAFALRWFGQAGVHYQVWWSETLPPQWQVLPGVYTGTNEEILVEDVPVGPEGSGYYRVSNAEPRPPSAD